MTARDHAIARVCAAAAAALALSLAACGPTRPPGATTPEPVSGGHLSRADAPAAQPPRTSSGADHSAADIPEPVSGAPPLPPPAEPQDTERYTAVVNQVPVRDLLFALARDADLEIDIIGDIDGKVTLNAIDETLPRLLERIELQAPIRYELRDDYLKIAADEPYLETYPVPYVNITRSSSSTVDTATQVSSTGFGEEGGAGGSGGSNNSSTRLSNESNNRFWETLRSNLTGLLNVEDVQSGDQAQDDRYIMINREAGYLTVRATQRQQREVQRYLDRVLASARRQVLIEATVIEVTLSDRYQAGVDWSLLANEANGLDIVQNVTGSALGGALNVPDPDNPGNPGVTIGYKDPQTSGGDLRSTIKLLDEFGDVRVMSSPKITALNNQVAILKVVDNRVYFTVDVQRDTARDTGNITRTFETQINTVPVGLVMTVTPYIGSDDEVLLNVRPTVSRILGFRNDPNPELAAEGVENEIPEIQVREMESLLRVNSGQIAMIGGLMQDKTDNTRRSVPGLGSLPLIGNLFSYRDDSVDKTELIIFMRPTVIDHASVSGDYSAYRRYLPDAPPEGDEAAQ